MLKRTATLAILYFSALALGWADPGVKHAPSTTDTTERVRDTRLRVGDKGLILEGEYKVVVTKLPFKLTCPDKADIYFWKVPTTWKAREEGQSLVVQSAPQGGYVVTLQAMRINWEKKNTDTLTYSLPVNVGKVVDPTPDPGPNPPDPPDPPDPTPKTEAPIAIKGLAVLVIYESKTATELPRAQQSVLFGKRTRDYLNEKCAPNPDRPEWKAWNIWDKDAELLSVGKVWKDAMARPRSSVPWVIISNGTRNVGYEGPLPANPDAMLKKVREYE